MWYTLHIILHVLNIQVYTFLLGYVYGRQTGLSIHCTYVLHCVLNILCCILCMYVFVYVNAHVHVHVCVPAHTHEYLMHRRMQMEAYV